MNELRYTAMLIFEIGPECNLGKAHAKCPNQSPERFARLSTDRDLDADTIVACAMDAYQNRGFTGHVGFHYYCEPMVYAQTMVGIISRVKSACPTARFILWTNGTIKPDQATKALFDRIVQTDYRHDPHGNQLDDRLHGRVAHHTGGCLRPLTEFILDCHGNHHPCCYDWKGEASLGNVFTDGLYVLLTRWQQLQLDVCRAPIADAAPERCKTCGYRPSNVTCFDIATDLRIKGEWKCSA
jgi:hypothetical protein